MEIINDGDPENKLPDEQQQEEGWMMTEEPGISVINSKGIIKAVKC